MASASFDSTIGIWERMAKDDQDSDDDENGGGEASGIQEEWENVGSLEGEVLLWQLDTGSPRCSATKLPDACGLTELLADNASMQAMKARSSQ